MKKSLLALFLINMCLSCVVPHIELSEAELALQEELKKEFKCDEIEFVHDYNSIKKTSSDGTFKVILCGKLCSMDSITLSNIALNITKRIGPLLSHRSNYNAIWFNTTIVQRDDKGEFAQTTCDKVVMVKLGDLKLLEYK